MSLTNTAYSQIKTPIKTIAFDFGGVIAKSDKNEINQFLAKQLEISYEEAYEIQNQLKIYCNQGRLEKEFWDYYTKTTGKELPTNWTELFDSARLKAIKEIPGTVQIVKELQKQGFQTAILSNVRINQAKLKRQLGYYDMFHPVLLSFEIGVKKPNLKSYQILLDQLKISPQQLLFIDNKEENVKAAKSLGIDAITFINAKQLAEELKKRGIILSIDNFNSLSTNLEAVK
jgi:putative hydrolase of the HAD superfamily